MKPPGYPARAIPAFQHPRGHQAAKLLRARPSTFGQLAEVMREANTLEALKLLRAAGILHETPGRPGEPTLYRLLESIKVPALPLPNGRAVPLARQIAATPGKSFDELLPLLPEPLQREPDVARFFLDQLGKAEMISVTTSEEAVRIHPTEKLRTFLHMLDHGDPP